MSCAETSEASLCPGDLLVAHNMMRAWESTDCRGHRGPYIEEGQQCMLLQTWTVGNQRRLHVLFNDRVLLFSSAEHCLHRNWSVANRG
jgi:hypothetical protein